MTRIGDYTIRIRDYTFAWLRGSRGLVINAPSALGKRSTVTDVIATIKPDLSGKVAIVTGGNSGIGVETVKALASAKCKVIMACRNVAAGKTAREDMYRRYDIDVEELDLNDLASVKAFADRVNVVDLLVLNAGIMALNQKELTVDGFEKQIGVNHFGHAYLTRLLRPKLEARGTLETPSRIVVVASLAHTFADKEWTPQDLDFKQVKYSPWGAYGNSKLANILFAKALAKRLPETVTAVSLHPGIIRTPLWRKLGRGGSLLARFLADKSIPQGAATTVWAAVAPSVPRGEYLDDCAVASKRSDQAKDDTLADALWDVTESRLDAAVAKRGL